MSRPIRVVHVIGSMEVGGAERQLVELMTRLPAEHFDQRLVLFRRRGPLLAALDDAGIDVVDLGSPAARRGTPRPLRGLQAVDRLRRVLRRAGPDIVHTQLPTANVVGDLAARRATPPVVIASQLNLCRDRGARTWFQRRENRSLRRSTAVLANSRAIEDDLVRFQGVDRRSIRVIHNGVDHERFRPPSPDEVQRHRRAAGIPDGTRVIAAVGNLHATKGHVDLVTAFARLRPADRDVVLLIAGREEAGADGVRRAVRALGVGANVRLLGPVERVEDVLACADLVVHPSHEEGFANAVLEAMATARPIVATAVGGTPEAIDDGVGGVLVPPSDPARLADAIERLLADPARAAGLGRAARRRVELDFGIDRMVRDYASWYAALAGRAVDVDGVLELPA